MATRRQREHGMLVSAEEVVKAVKRDCDRLGLNNHKDWESVFRLNPPSMKSGRRR